ncbi:hypothetical protein CUP99_19040, partial [Salmonella enterica subsp. houtenae serovar 53:z4,z23:-]|nr:hypothetical protein [Salmonella enterica subsp. houtenae serovar 53:z4,z23:-]
LFTGGRSVGQQFVLGYSCEYVDVSKSALCPCVYQKYSKRLKITQLNHANQIIACSFQKWTLVMEILQARFMADKSR